MWCKLVRSIKENAVKQTGIKRDLDVYYKLLYRGKVILRKFDFIGKKKLQHMH
jgi:hypothetical protein